MAHFLNRTQSVPLPWFGFRMAIEDRERLRAVASANKKKHTTLAREILLEAITQLESEINTEEKRSVA